MKELGFSGDMIEVCGGEVIKTCHTNQSRFLRNIRKQKSFQNPNIQAVQILEQGTNSSGQNFIKMPLLRCENTLMWLSKASAEDIESVIQMLTAYLKSLLAVSQVQDFPLNSWTTKVAEVKGKLSDIELQHVCDRLMSLDTSVPIYHGPSHGDFTFSNMFIYQDGKVSIDVIDFLDTFMESPIHDFVKIRQDTRHLWTLQLIDGVDRNKIVMVLHHIDLQIQKIIDDDHIINHYYQYFQTLNMLRIIPYSKSSDTIRYLKKEIQKCLL